MQPTTIPARFENFLVQRGFALLVIATGLLLWWVSGTQTEQQIQWLRDDYRLTPVQFQTFFLGVVLLFVPVLVWEPWLRSRMRQPGIALVVVVMAAVVACSAVLVLRPDQPHRLFRTPNLLLYAILYVVSVSGLLAYGVSQSLAKYRRLMLWLLGVLALLLWVVNVAAVGRFARFDDVYDEAYLASGGVHYALHGGISPSYTGSAYGDPDPALARYYVLMGLWLRLLGSTDLVALRSFSMLVGAVAAAMTALALWRQGLRWGQVLVGVVVILALSTFVRTAHNVRMDIGLAVCAALVLLFFLEALRHSTGANRSFFFAGLSLYLGMESVPTVTLNFGVAVGIAVIVAALDVRRRRLAWRPVLAYTVGAGVACLAYLLVHYAPDFEANFATMSDFSRVYVNMESVVAGQWERLLNFIRMSATLSPLEPLLVTGLCVLLLWRGDRVDRLVVGIALLTLGLIVLTIGGSYGYLAVLAPMVAYAAARLFAEARLQPALALFLLPVLAAAPLHDMGAMIAQNPNAAQLAVFTPVVDAIPEGSTVIGPDLMWFVFNDRTDYIGWTGLGIYRQRREIREVLAIAELAPDVLICEETSLHDCTDYAPDVAPMPIETERGRYLLYAVNTP